MTGISNLHTFPRRGFLVFARWYAQKSMHCTALYKVKWGECYARTLVVERGLGFMSLKPPDLYYDADSLPGSCIHMAMSLGSRWATEYVQYALVVSLTLMNEIGAVCTATVDTQ